MRSAHVLGLLSMVLHENLLGCAQGLCLLLDSAGQVTCLGMKQR